MARTTPAARARTLAGVTCRCPPIVHTLWSSADRVAPGRSTASDGCCASAAHHTQNPDSDHEADASGWAHAGDVTHDLAHRFDSWQRADELRLACKTGVEKRVKYIISNRRIASAKGGWVWRRYSGPNAHDHHMHVSFLTGYELSTAPFFDYGIAGVDGQPRNPGTTAPLPVVLTYTYDMEDGVKLIDTATRIALDGDGNGYTDLPDVPRRAVVSHVVNGADPQTAGGYPPQGVDVEVTTRDGVTRVVAYDGPPHGTVDIDVWSVAA